MSTTAYIVQTNRSPPELIAAFGKREDAEAFSSSADLWDHAGKIGLNIIEVPWSPSVVKNDWQKRYEAADRLLDGEGTDADVKCVKDFLGSDADTRERSKLCAYWMFREDGIDDQRARSMADWAGNTMTVFISQEGFVCFGGQPILIRNQRKRPPLDHELLTINETESVEKRYEPFEDMPQS